MGREMKHVFKKTPFYFQARRTKEELKSKAEQLVSARPNRLRIRNMKIARNVTTTTSRSSTTRGPVTESPPPPPGRFSEVTTVGSTTVRNSGAPSITTVRNIGAPPSTTTVKNSPATTVQQVAEKINRNSGTTTEGYGSEEQQLEVTSLKALVKEYRDIRRTTTATTTTTTTETTSTTTTATTTSSTTSSSSTTTRTTTESVVTSSSSSSLTYSTSSSTVSSVPPATEHTKQSKLSLLAKSKPSDELKKDLLDAIRRKISKNKADLAAEKESKPDLGPKTANLRATRLHNLSETSLASNSVSTKPPFFRPIAYPPQNRNEPQSGRPQVKIFVNLPDTKPGSIVKIPNVSHIQVINCNLYCYHCNQYCYH